jgi:hypothetical protein
VVDRLQEYAKTGVFRWESTTETVLATRMYLLM